MNWEIKQIDLQAHKQPNGSTLYKLSLVKRKGEGDTLITEQTDKDGSDLKFMLSIVEGFLS